MGTISEVCSHANIHAFKQYALVLIRCHVTIPWAVFISVIGQGWLPAALNTEEESVFIRLGQKTFRNSVPYWIKGSTEAQIGHTFNFPEYIDNDDGTVCNWILIYFPIASCQLRDLIFVIIIPLCVFETVLNHYKYE